MSLDLKRNLATALFLIIAIAVPLFVFTLEYPNMWTLKKDLGVKIAGIAGIILVVLLFVFRKFVKARMAALQHGWIKKILLVIATVSPGWILYGVVWSIDRYIDVFKHVIMVVAICETVAWGLIYPFIMDYDFLIAKEKRKNEITEALKEGGLIP